MLPPGLAFAALSDKAWQFVERSTLPKFISISKRAEESDQEPERLYARDLAGRGAGRIPEDDPAGRLENIIARHARLAKATRAAMAALGLQLYAPQLTPTPSPPSWLRLESTGKRW